MTGAARGRSGPGRASRAWTAVEVVVGLGMLAAAAVAGLLLAKRPGPNRVDATGYFYVPSDPGSRVAEQLVKLGSLRVLIVGIVVIFVAEIWRDWIRAFACSVAPVVAVLVVEHIAKPMVGREIGGGGYTYPSGTVTVTAALAASLLLVSPRLMRPLTAVIGALAVAGVGVGVLVLRWHYPTDVVGGIWVGVGSVFTIDGIVHLPWLVRARTPEALNQRGDWASRTTVRV